MHFANPIEAGRVPFRLCAFTECHFSTGANLVLSLQIEQHNLARHTERLVQRKAQTHTLLSLFIRYFLRDGFVSAVQF